MYVLTVLPATMLVDERVVLDPTTPHSSHRSEHLLTRIGISLSFHMLVESGTVKGIETMVRLFFDRCLRDE